MSKTDSVLYIELAPQDFLERLETCPVAYLPLGTLEYHGPHLPLGTDLLQGDALFRLAAKQFGGIVMPGLFMGPDRHTREGDKDYYGMDVYIDVAKCPAYYPLQQLPGSAYWLPDDLYEALLKAILSQLARAGFRVVVGRGHGPSTSGFMALKDWAQETLHLTLLTTDIGSPVKYIHDHAGKSETSNIMYFYPELVHMDRLPEDLSVFAPGMGGEDPRTSASAAYTEGNIPIVLEHLGRTIREALTETDCHSKQEAYVMTHKTSSVHYENLAPQEFLERLNACPVAYLPLGALEWHGPHLPLGTDLLEGRDLFTLAAERIGGIVLPGLFLGPDRHTQQDGTDYYGMDIHIDIARCPAYYPLQQLPGSAYWIPDDLYDRLIEAIVSQLARAGFRGIVGYGHTPSNDRFFALTDRMWKRYQVRLLLLDFGEPEFGYIQDHGSKTDTSNIMYFHPGLVHMDRLPEDLSVFAPGMGGEDPRTSASAAYTEGNIPIVLEHLGRTIRETLEKLQ